MSRDRGQRYPSAADLAHDIQSYLENRPLVAGPPSAVYRARKFLSRHKLPVAAAAAVLLALGLGVAATGIALVGQSRARAEAELGQARAEAVVNFLTQDILANATPARLPDKHVRDTIIRIMLEPATESITQRFGQTPVVEAQVRDLLAQCYRLLDRNDLSLPLAQRALQQRRKLLGDDHPETMVSVNTVASIFKDQGLLAQAEAMHRENAERRRRVLGADDPETLTSLSNLATILQMEGRLEESAALSQQVLEGFRRNFSDDHQHVLTSMNNLAMVLKAQGKLDDAERMYRAVLEKYLEIHGEEHPRTLTLRNNLAALLRTRGKPAEAEPLLRSVLETRKRILGEDHSDTLGAMHNLAVVLREQNRLEEAEVLCRQVLEARRRTVGEYDLRTLSAMNNLIAVLMQRGNAGDAIPLLNELQERMPQTQLPARNAADYLSNGGRALVRLGRYDAAEKPLLEARRLLQENNVGNTKAMRDVLSALVRVYEKTDRSEEAALLRSQLDAIAPTTTASEVSADPQ